LIVPTNEFGEWQVDFTDTVDITKETYGYLWQYDEAGNYTEIYWFALDPIIKAHLNIPNVAGERWPAYTPITLEINGQTWTEVSTSYGDISFNIDPVIIEPGLVIEMSGGGYTRSHTVIPITTTSIDDVNNTISGTANSLDEVVVEASWEARLTVPTDDSGNWLANFTGLVDIVPGTSGYVRQYDADGDCTHLNWYVPDPYIGVGLTYNEVIGEMWPANTWVTLTIDGQQWTNQSESSGWVSFYVSPFDIQPGDIIEMTDGTISRTYQTANLSVTEINEIDDTLRGTADPDQEVEIYGWDDVHYEWKYDTADSSGNWQVDFSGSIDIKPGTKGSVWQYDQDHRNYTALNWSVADPYIYLFHNQNEDVITIHGEDWPAHTAVTMTLNGVQTTKQTDEYGWAWFGAYYPGEIFGNPVYMTDGKYERTYTIQALDFTEIDIQANTVSGTSDPDTQIEVFISDVSGIWPRVETMTNSSGDWLADFTGKADIQIGNELYAEREDKNGNRTQIYWQIPNPYIAATIGSAGLYGDDWSANTLVTLTLNDALDFTGQSDNTGYVWFNVYPNHILPGDKLVMTDGIDTRTHYVANLSITEWDLLANTVSGTADPYQEVNVYVDNNFQNGSLNVIANGSGLWQANFDGYIDVQPGSYLRALQADAEENFTAMTTMIPNPHIRVSLPDQIIQGYEWEETSEVSLFIDDVLFGAEFTSNWGFVYFDTAAVGIEPGQEIRMTDGIVSRTHLVRNITITDVDQESDIVSGTAEPNSMLYISGFNDSSGHMGYAWADQDGYWMTNFGGWIDIGPGAYGDASQYDDQSNFTTVSWYVPKPEVSVYQLSDRVFGRMFSPETQVTLTIGGYEWTAASNLSGSVNFEVTPFDILPGMSIQMTDGENSLSYTVNNIMITEINPVTDILKGKTKPGSEVFGVICEGSSCYGDYFTADTSGLWTADFSTTIDMTADTNGYVYQVETSNYVTILEWHVPDPVIHVYPLGDYAYGYDFTPNDAVTFTVADQAETWSATADMHGKVYFDLSPFDLEPDQTVEASDGIFSASHTIFDITVTSINQTISGTGMADWPIEVQACDETTCEWVNTTTDSSGNWTADFNGLVNIAAGTTGWAKQADPEGDYTIVNWFITDPQLVVDPEADEVYGYKWPANQEISLEITDSSLTASTRQTRAIWTGTSDETGTVIFYIAGEFDIVPGQTVELQMSSDESVTVTHQTRSIAVTELDPDADLLFGITEANEDVTVTACNLLSYGQLTTTAYGDGLWQADFSGIVNIVPGATGTACVIDELGEKTCVNWEVEEGFQIFLPLIIK
jgi:hypothetical protein